MNVAVFARNASECLLCLFDETGERETARFALPSRSGDVHHGFVPGLGAGAPLRPQGRRPVRPREGPSLRPVEAPGRSLCAGPRPAVPLCRRSSRRRAAPRSTPRPSCPAPIVTGTDLEPAPRSARTGPPGLIYEVAVKAFTQAPSRDQCRPCAAPLAGARRARRSSSISCGSASTHVELMPIAAWMDERHLPPLGLSNAWGYNPIVFMAPDPRLAPGGVEEVRATVDAPAPGRHLGDPRRRLQSYRRGRRRRPDGVACAASTMPSITATPPTIPDGSSTTRPAATRSPATARRSSAW